MDGSFEADFNLGDLSTFLTDAQSAYSTFTGYGNQPESSAQPVQAPAPPAANTNILLAAGLILTVILILK